MWKIYFFPYEHFWFLQAIALIFVFVALLDHFRLLEEIGGYLVVLLLCVFGHFAMHLYPSLFSIDKAFYLLPFFVAGLGANRFRSQLWSTPVRILAMAAFAGSVIPYAMNAWEGGTSLPDAGTPWVTLIGMSGILTLMFFVPASKLLGWVGGFSFSIYLYHVFFTAGARIGLSAIGEFPIQILVLIGLSVGVAGPIIVEMALRRNRYVRNIFLGQS